MIDVQDARVGRRAVETAKRFFDARLSRVSTPHDAHRVTRTPSSRTMSRAAHDDRVYALFDVPGTGFRDREGTGMFTQYHKMGWQKDFRSEDSPENQYDLSCNPVVIVGLPQDVDARSVRTQCEHQFGAVARVHRPTRVVSPEPRGAAREPRRDENLGDAGKRPAAPSLESFAIVEFADDASAARATHEGVLSFANTRDDEREELGPPDTPVDRPTEASRENENGGDFSFVFKIVPRKTLVADVARWRREIRASFRDASEARVPFRNVGPSDDPTDWCNAGNAFRRTFPEFAGAK